jgi:predicted regulator of Ras-like GTPase activity (Roadblock/LC7/MglB family)
MIQASKLSELFHNAIDNGIDFVFFKDLTGDILWMEGKDTNKILTDVLSSMWLQYKEVQDKFIKEKLTYMIIENDDSNIIATTIYNYILVMKANNNTMQLGELKMHLSSLAETLNKTFEKFKDIMEEESKGLMQ